MRVNSPQQNRDTTGHSEKRKEGIIISHGTGFVLLLLVICLAVLVGLVVHFASPAQLVCTCENTKTEVPTLSPEELKGRCVEIVKGGDQEIYTAEFNYACKGGVSDCAADALRMFRAWKNDTVNNRLDPNLIHTIICNAVRYGGMAEWTFAYYQYWNSPQGVIRSHSLRGMACTTRLWLAQRMLNMALDVAKIHPSDARYLMSRISSESTSNQIVWNFIKQNYSLLAEKFSEFEIATLISDVANGHSSEYFQQELQYFANVTAAMGYYEYTTPLKAAIKNTKTNMDWMKTNHDVIKDWLVEQGLTDYLP